MKADLPFFGSRRTLILCAVLVILVVAAAWMVGGADGAFEADPDYTYLLNGLELLTLRSPAYYTHPGTPVEMIAAITIAATWLASSLRHGLLDIRDQVLAGPLLYLGWINIVFTAFIAASLAFFACQVRQASGRIFPALVGGLTFFLPLPVFLAFHRVTPEPLLLAGGLVLAGLVAPLVFSPASLSRRRIIAIGAIIGFCIAVKVTAAPLLVAILFLRGKAARTTALAAALLTAVVLTLPVASHYLEMALWYVGLFTHQGGYGNGAAGAPGMTELAGDAATLVTAIPEIFVCVAVYLVFILARLRHVPGHSVRALSLCVLLVLITLLAVLKQPEARYTIAAVPFLCLGNAIAAQSFFASKFWSRLVLVALLTVAGLWFGIARIQHVQGIQRGNAAVLQLADSSPCLLVPYYGVNTVLNNLYFGDGWTHYIYRDRLARLYPGFVYFNSTSGDFETFSSPMTNAAAHTLFARQQCVTLIGSPVERLAGFPIAPKFLSRVARSPGSLPEAIALYRLDWAGSFKGATPTPP